MGEKMIEFLQRQSDIDADNILAEVNADPEMADVHAPDEMEAALFACIDEYDMKKAHSNLSEEDRELIELGKAYKKSKKRRKYAAVASIALAGVLLSSVKAMGGPEKVIEVVRRMVEEREHTVVNTDDERLESVKVVTELEAFEQIEKVFGKKKKKMYYVPKGIIISESLIDKATQYINMTYQGEKNEVITYVIRPNYNIGSVSSDIADVLVEEYKMEVEGRNIYVKHFQVSENGEDRWVLEFTEESIYYFIQICNLEKSRCLGSDFFDGGQYET